MSDVKAIVQQFAKQIQPRIGNTLMKARKARIGRPTDDTLFVSDGNFPDNKAVYIYFVSDNEPLSFTTALLGNIRQSDVYKDRPVDVKLTDSGFYTIVGFTDEQDAIFSDGIEEIESLEPVYNSQLVEQTTLHPTEASGIIVRIYPGMLGSVWYSGADTPDFSTGTVQDTAAANITMPATNGQSKGVLIQVDADTATLEYKQSSEFSSTLSLVQAYKAGLLPTVDAGRYLLGYLKLTAGMTDLASYADLWSVISRVIGFTGGAVDTLTLNDGSELTIASDAITVTHARHTVDTEADAASDILSTVNGLAANEICLITANHTDRTITLQGGGNLTFVGGAGFILDDTEKAALLVGNTAGTGVLVYPLFPEVTADSITNFTGKTFLDGVSIGGDDDELQLQVVSWNSGTQTATIFRVLTNSAFEALTVNPTEVVINQDGRNNIDFRIETDNLSQAFLVDASGDGIGIGTVPDASAILDIVSTAKGFAPPRMTSAQWAAISSPINGLIAYDTTLHEYVGIKNGSSAIIGSSPSADGIIFTDPTLQTWTALNQSTGVYSDTTDKRLYIREVNTTGSVNRGWSTPVPSDPTVTPYVVTAHIKMINPNNYVGNGVHFAFRQNSTGELSGIEYFYLSATADSTLYVRKWNSPSSFNSAYVSIETHNEIAWFQLEDDGVDRFYRVSPDGISWITLHQVTRTDFLTADEICFLVTLNGNTPVETAVTMLSYEES